MRFLVQRAAGAVVLFWLVVSLTFALVHAAPGDPGALLVPPTASPADVARLRARFGLDAPLPVQYARWTGAFLKGDLGESLSLHRPVAGVLRDALPVSAALGVTSLLLTFVAGVAVGMAQAARRGRTTDVALTIAMTSLYAAPAFWLSLALVAVFTYGAAMWNLPAPLRLPAFGIRDPAGEARGVSAALDVLRHALLPVAVLTAIGAAGVARYARSTVADLERSDWVRTARAKGLSPLAVQGRHVLANALPPIIVLLALSFPGVVAGSVFVEGVFAWPGMGHVLLGAIAARDYPLVMGATALYAAAVIVANLAADLALPLLDPRRGGAA